MTKIMDVRKAYKINQQNFAVPMSFPDQTGLSVVLAVIDVSNELLRLVQLLVQGSGPELKEILLVHNGPGKPGLGYQPALALGRVRLVISPPGLANARNAGLAETKTELVAFLDHDVTVSQNWAAEVVGGFAKYPEASVLGGEVNLLWPGPKPTWMDSVMAASLSEQKFDSQVKIMGPGDFLVGANLTFRSAHLQLVGGFPSYLGRVGHSLLSNEELVPQMKMDLLGFRRYGTRAFSVDAPVQQERLTKRWMTRRFAWQAVSDELAEAFDEFHSPGNLASDTNPINSFTLTQIRTTVGALLRGEDAPRIVFDGHPEIRSPVFDSRQRFSQGYRIVEFERGGHLRLARRLCEILDGKLTILRPNPWVERPGLVFAELQRELSFALNANERVLIVTADPLLRAPNLGFLKQFLDLGSVDFLRLLSHRPRGQEDRLNTSLEKRLLQAEIRFSPSFPVRSFSTQARQPRTVSHPVLGKSRRVLSRREAKKLLNIPANSWLIVSVGSHLTKDLQAVLPELTRILATEHSVHFLFMGAASHKQLEAVSVASSALPGRITNLLAVPRNEWEFETALDTELEIALQAADCGLILEAGTDYFPSSALEYLRFGNPVMYPDELSSGRLWAGLGLAFPFKSAVKDSLAGAARESLKNGRPARKAIQLALKPHQETAVRGSLVSVFESAS